MKIRSKKQTFGHYVVKSIAQTQDFQLVLRLFDVSKRQKNLSKKTKNVESLISRNTKSYLYEFGLAKSNL